MAEKQQVGLIIVGNSGVGKSLMANIIVGEEKFQHEFRSSAVTTATELHAVQIPNGPEVSVFNIPGLIENDPNAIERNKQEIQKAFATRPVSIIMFIFGHQGGRIREEDVVAFEALDKAYQLKRNSLCFVVNDLPPPGRRPAQYEGETTVRLQQLLKISGDLKIAFVDRLDNLDDQNGRTAIRNTLTNLIVRCTPAVHKKVAEIRLQADEISSLKADIKKQQKTFDDEKAKWSKDIAAMQEELEKEKNKPAVVIEKHFERVIESGGGFCSIM